jgi:hypothetical protein
MNQAPSAAMLISSAPTSSEARPNGAMARIVREIEHHPAIAVLILALLVRLAFATASFLLNHRWLIPDEGQYLDLAKQVSAGHPADSWFPNYGQSLYDTTWVFVAPIVFLFKVISPTRIVAQLWPAVAGALSAALTTRIALEAVRRRWALLAGVAVALLPSQVVWSSVVLRESLIWAALATVALGIALSGRSSGARLFLCGGLVFGALVAVTFLRAQTAVVAAWAVVLACAVGGRRRLVRTVGAVAIATVAPVLGGLGPAGVRLVQSAAPTLGITRTYMAFGAKSAFVPNSPVPPAGGGPSPSAAPSGASGTGPSPGGTAQPGAPRNDQNAGALAIASRPSGTVRNAKGHALSVVQGPRGQLYAVDNSVRASLSEAPRGLVATTVRPFPWEHSSTLPAKLARVENIVWYVLYGLAFVGVVLGRRHLRTLAYPLIVGGAILAVAAVTQGNLGTSFRHRAQIFWAVAVLGAVALDQLERRRWLRRAAPARSTAGSSEPLAPQLDDEVIGESLEV